MQVKDLLEKLEKENQTDHITYTFGQYKLTIKEFIDILRSYEPEKEVFFQVPSLMGMQSVQVNNIEKDDNGVFILY